MRSTNDDDIVPDAFAVSTNPSREEAKVSFVNSERFVPIRSAKEVREDLEKSLEASVVKTICGVFNLNTKEIYRATYSETGERRLGVAGFTVAVSPRFPAQLICVKPSRGKGKAFTLNRLLSNPVKFPLIGEFIHEKLLNRSPRPLMLIGLHPRITSYVAVTDLDLEPAALCFHSVLEVKTSEHSVKRISFIIGEFGDVLRAMQHQGVWHPEINFQTL
jgi:hypothetical protein